MKSQQLLIAAIALATIMMAFVGITAFTEGDPLPTLTLFLTGATPILTAVAVMMNRDKVDKTFKVSEATDLKVDQLLNGSFVGRLRLVERDVADVKKRLGAIESSTLEILAEIRQSRAVRRVDSPDLGADQLPHR